MLDDLISQFDAVKQKMDTLRGYLDLAHKKEEIQKLQKLMESPSLWDNPSEAKKVSQGKTRIEKEIQEWEGFEKDFEEISLLIDLSRESGEDSLYGEIRKNLNKITSDLAQTEIRRLLSGEKDINNAILTIHPGAGGTESQDWAQMLLRMYSRWAEKNNYRVELIDLLPGEEAGIKSATLSISGEYAYGKLKAEAGIHRLVRISPFDSNKRRHTSFASVFVYPEIEDDIEITVDEKDLRIDTYRASSAGGQNVNKVSSAVRITHLPSGIVVQSQNERSQLQNKNVCMKVLKAKLYDLEREKKDSEMADLTGEKKEIGWGHQIRSYVFQPYQMVKDHRTNKEIGNIQLVMDGGIEPFIEAYLAARR
ncbi:MAG: peptide chain release factor 2 [Nitrospirae bacterium]|nr:peptide chain release factor 2 [Nitrospirota bacterium]